jgi:hypothetical protein
MPTSTYSGCTPKVRRTMALSKAICRSSRSCSKAARFCATSFNDPSDAQNLLESVGSLNGFNGWNGFKMVQNQLDLRNLPQNVFKDGLRHFKARSKTPEPLSAWVHPAACKTHVENFSPISGLSGWNQCFCSGKHSKILQNKIKKTF